MNKTIMITGANSGLGKDAARQLALISETEKIYLAVRSESKGKAAKVELEKATGRSIFEVTLMDTSNVASVKKAVNRLNEPIDALIMNAGGVGGKAPGKRMENGMTYIAAQNLLGHTVLVDELIQADKLKNVAMFASSEAVRGVKSMGMAKPTLKNSTTDEFVSVLDGTFFEGKVDGIKAYGFVKLSGTYWMSSMARKHPDIRFISMSPGATSGTSVMNDLAPFKRFMFKYVGMPILMPLLGMVHKLEKGARRYVDAISNESLISGTFYASPKGKLVGAFVDQSDQYPELKNESYQDNAYEALHRFTK